MTLRERVPLFLNERDSDPKLFRLAYRLYPIPTILFAYLAWENAEIDSTLIHRLRAKISGGEEITVLAFGWLGVEDTAYLVTRNDLDTPSFLLNSLGFVGQVGVNPNTYTFDDFLAGGRLLADRFESEWNRLTTASRRMLPGKAQGLGEKVFHVFIPAFSGSERAGLSWNKI